MTKQPHAIPVRPDYVAAARNAPNHLARAVFVAARAKAERKTAEQIFEQLFRGDDVSPGVLERAAAPLGTTTGGGDVHHMVRTAVAEFLGGLVPLSAAAALMRVAGVLMLDVTNTIGAINVPVRPAGPAAPGWVPEGAPIAGRGDALDTVELGPARKIGAIVVASRELLKRSDAARVFITMLREDAGKGLDAGVFSDEDGNSDAHQGLLNGATAVAGSGDPIKDLRRLASSVSVGGSGQVAFVGGPGLAAALNLDAVINATILPSPAVSESRLIAVDPLSIVWGADETPDIEVATQAVIHMDTDPLPIVDGATAAPVRALWQTDTVATRLLLPIAFAKRRAGCVAFIDNIDYLS